MRAWELDPAPLGYEPSEYPGFPARNNVEAESGKTKGLARVRLAKPQVAVVCGFMKITKGRGNVK